MVFFKECVLSFDLFRQPPLSLLKKVKNSAVDRTARGSTIASLCACSLNTLDLLMSLNHRCRSLSANFSTWVPRSASCQPFSYRPHIPMRIIRAPCAHKDIHMLVFSHPSNFLCPKSWLMVTKLVPFKKYHRIVNSILTVLSLSWRNSDPHFRTFFFFIWQS